MDKINVLWMNNGDESLVRFVEGATNFNIDISTCSSMAACMESIDDACNNWDVVMINETYQGKKGKRHLNSIEENFKEKTKAKCISCFIVTDKESFNPMIKFSLKSYTQEFYSLRKKEELFRNIIAAPESNLRKKYSEICTFCTDSHLIPLLQVLEGYKQIMPPTTIPNECRKLLEWVQKNSIFTGRKLPKSIKDYLDRPVKKDKTTCETYDDLSLNDFSKAVDKTNYVPEYVKRSFHHCCNITQEGSHLLEIDDLLSKGMVPYVNQSLIYNLLNILHWCATK